MDLIELEDSFSLAREFGHKCFSITSFLTFLMVIMTTIVNVNANMVRTRLKRLSVLAAGQAWLFKISNNATLGSEINVGSGINIGVGRFGKNNKRRVRNNSRGGNFFMIHKGP